MKVKMLVWPHCVSVLGVILRNPTLFWFLCHEGVDVEPYHWDGKESLLPTDELVLVRVSSMLKSSELESTVSRCNQLGHLVFYDDFIIPDGYEHIFSEDPDRGKMLLEAAAAFLERVRARE